MAEAYDKLVRDDIPAIIEANGDAPIVHVADDEEYGRRLVEKLREEVEEFAESGDVEELADVLEVVHAIRAHRGLAADELADVRAEKAAERGRFDERIVLERVEPDGAA